MSQQIAGLALLVHDYDDAIAFFTEKIGFLLLEDTQLSESKRWVRVGPEDGSSWLLLARAATPEQAAQVGNQSGGRVFLFLHTDDFQRDYARMTGAGVEFLEAPRTEPYGTVAVFVDLYGNKWDLIEQS